MEERLPCPSCNPGPNGNLEGSPGCPYCKGLGWLWDDKIVTGWLYNFEPRKAQHSMIAPNSLGREKDADMRLVTINDYMIFPGDFIFDIKLDQNKRIHMPLILQERFLCVYSDRYTSSGINSEYNVAGLKR